MRDNLALKYFMDSERDPEIWKAFRKADIKDRKSTLLNGKKFEAAQQASHKDRHNTPRYIILDLNWHSPRKKRAGYRQFSVLRKRKFRNEMKCWSCGLPCTSEWKK